MSIEKIINDAWENKDHINQNSDNSLKDAINKVIETNRPKATVPPKSDAIKIKNPKNKTTDVYNILTPVSCKAAKTDSLIEPLVEISSCLYLAK